MLRRIKKIVSIFSCTFLLLGAGICVAEDTVIDPNQVIPYEQWKDVNAEIGNYTENKKFDCKILYPDKTKVTYQGSPAYFEKCFVSKGDRVEKGQVIASFRTEGDPVALLEAELECQRYKDQRNDEMETRKNELDNMKERLSAVQDFAENRQLSLEISIKMLELEKYELQSGKTLGELTEKVQSLRMLAELQYVYAPVSAVVTELTVFKTAEEISPGRQIAVLTDDQTVFISCEVPERMLFFGQEAFFDMLTDMGKLTGKARVVSSSCILPGIVKENRVLLKLERVGEYEGKMAEELFLSLPSVPSFSYVSRSADGALLVSKKALIHDENMDYVYIRKDENHYTRKPVYTITYATNLNTWVLHGLTPEDKIREKKE